jgi:hypothetical protein
MVTKLCVLCNIEKDYSEFSLNKNGRYGLHSQCKTCKSNVSKYRYANGDSYALRLQKLYGLTVDEYKQLYAEANGCCQVCGISEENNNKRLAVDHCHTTGKVRGLLCGKCNTALGQLDDNLNKISSLYSYLKERQ